MSTEIKRVLVVDDSPDDIHFVMESFPPEYAVLAATSGEKALQLANKEPNPDIILMDVEMPGMNGYETCRRLKSEAATRDIDVIFLSSHDDIEEKLAGYDAGGSDYLIKPVQKSELVQKVKLAIDNRLARLASAQETNTAMQTAMTAISSAGEQGVVIDFLRRSFETGTIAELADLIVEANQNYQLHSSVQIRTPKGPVYASSSKPMPPLEQELLTKLQDAGRINEVNNRLILNFGDISVLIKNLPEDADKRGRVRDHLAILLEGAESRLKTLRMEEELAKAISDSNEALLENSELQKTQKETAMAIMDRVMQNLEASFLSWGLTEDQETLLMNVVQTGVDESLENFEKGLVVDERLRGIVDGLTNALKLYGKS